MATWSDVSVEIVRSTPKLLLSFTILVILTILVAAAGVGCVAAISGRAVDVFGFRIEEFKSPDVQKCAAMMAAVHNINEANADALAGIRDQIAQSMTIKSQQIYNISTELQDQIKQLISAESEIYAARNNALASIGTGCGLPAKTRIEGSN